MKNTSNLELEDRLGWVRLGYTFYNSESGLQDSDISNSYFIKIEIN